MTLPAIRNDILSSTVFQDQIFKLQRRQEISRQAGGVTRGKDFGSPLWYIEFTTAPMDNDDGVAFEAIMNSLDGVIGPFYAGDQRRRYPRAHADGAFLDTAEIHTVGGDNKSMRLKQLAAGFKLSVGDYLCFDYGDPAKRALHQVMEDAVADGGGVTPFFEVRPFFRPGVAADIAVTLKKPTGVFTLLPDSIDSRISGIISTVVSFRAMQFL